MKVKVVIKLKQTIFWVSFFFWYETIDMSNESSGLGVWVWDGATYAEAIIMPSK